MKALILNSGLGSRMGEITAAHPKCMTEISPRETILSRQLAQLADFGISRVIITTGPFREALEDYCRSLDLPMEYSFVHNPEYRETNYIYSIYLAREYLDEDLILMHGDLVFENRVMEKLLIRGGGLCADAGPGEGITEGVSCVTVSSSAALPPKDFKAVVKDGLIEKIGIEFFENAVAAQPLYYLRRKDVRLWMDKIAEFVSSGRTKVYAENALNEINADCAGEKIELYPLDTGDLLCAEVDNPEDLRRVSEKLKTVSGRTVYLCFSTDLIHGGHMAILRRARRLGKLIIGVLSDEAVASFKRFPLLPARERMRLFENIAGVSRVVEQRTLSYRENLEKYRPDIVVHGDDWCSGFQKPIRDEVVDILAAYGGELAEFPYSRDEQYREIQRRERAELSMPDLRRGRLRRLLEMKPLVTVMEAHDGLTGLVVENTVVHEQGGGRQFDAMWLSSLCDSTARGKPDIELVDMTSRFRTLDDIMEVTTKPIIFDGDTGGLTEHFVYTVRSLERMGVSMVIIEDKEGLKKNSLFGTEVKQTQASIEDFCRKIRAGKNAQRTRDFMICARIESLILEKGMEDALERARAFVAAGADAIMIHSRKKEPDEIFEFIGKFREEDRATPLVLVPTSFNSVREEEWIARGANIIIYANQLMRAAVPAIQSAAESILRNHRAAECDAALMPFKDIIRLIPEE